MEVSSQSSYYDYSMQRLLLVLFIFFSSTAYADLEVKKAVFTDCPSALEQSNKLNDQERGDLVRYLTEVLRLSTSQPRIPSSILSRPGSKGEVPFDDHSGSDLWRSFDPAREVEAKRCAVEMLGALSPASIESLPELASLTMDRATALDLSSLIEFRSVDIANNFESTFQGAISIETLTRLFSLSLEKEGGIAQNHLIALHRVSVPYLFRELRLPDPDRRDQIVKILLLMEKGGAHIGQGFVSLLTSADDGLRKRSLGALFEISAYYGEALLPIVRRLSDVSPSVNEEAANILRRISKSNAAIFPIREASLVSDELLKAFRRLSDKEREDLIPALALFGSYGNQSFEEKILPLTLEGEDEGVRMRAIRVLGLLPSLSDRGFEAIMKNLTDGALGIQGSAMEALYGKQNRAQTIIEALGKVLSKKSQSLARPMLLLYMANVVKTFGSEANYESLLPFLIEALAIDFQDTSIANGTHVSAVTDAITTLGKKAVPSLLKALKSDNQIIRSRAATLLGSLGKSESSVVVSLIERLNDPSPSVSEASYRALLSMGSDAVSRAKKAKLSARTARLLSELGQAETSYLPVLLKAATQGPCTERPLYAKVIVKSYGSQSDALVNALLACISQIPGGDARLVDSLEALGPVSKESAIKIAEVLRDRSRVDDTVLLLVIEKGKAIGLDDETLVERASWLLENSETPIKLRVLSALTSLGAAAKGTIPLLEKIRDDDSVDYLLRYRAGVAAVSVDPSLMVDSRLVVEELGSDRSEWAEKALLAIPVDTARPVLEASLRDEAARLSALEVIGRLGERAAALLPVVNQILSETKDPKVRYASSLVVLKVSPSDGEAVLRRELVGRYAREIIKEDFPLKLREVLIKIHQNPKSFIEKAYSSALLYKN